MAGTSIGIKYVKDTFFLKMKAIQNYEWKDSLGDIICQRYFFFENESNSKLGAYSLAEGQDMSKILFF